MILEQLGIYGWKGEDEDLVMASLLTGDGAQRQHPDYLRHRLQLHRPIHPRPMSDEFRHQLKKHGLATLTILFDDAQTCDDFAVFGDVMQLEDATR